MCVIHLVSVSGVSELLGALALILAFASTQQDINTIKADLLRHRADLRGLLLQVCPSSHWNFAKLYLTCPPALLFPPLIPSM